MPNTRTKIQADHLLKISISRLKELGYLDMSGAGNITWPGNNGEVLLEIGVEILIMNGGYIRLRYWGQGTSNPNFIDTTFSLETTPCHFGGVRYWFRCSRLKETGDVCSERVGVLYKIGDEFGCRHCYELTYHSKTLRTGKGYYPIFRYKSLYYQMQELKTKIGRKHYRNRPTRKMERLKRLENITDALWSQSMLFVNALEERASAL